VTSMAKSVGSANNSDVGCCLDAIKAVDGATTCGWRQARGLERWSGVIDVH
jgi:hypothetical protein